MRYRVSAVGMVAVVGSVAQANVVGGDLQNFNAVPGGIDFVTVESSETLEPGYLNLGLMANHAVNSLPYYEDAAQNRVKYNDALTYADLGVGAGVAESLEVGFAVQDLASQHVSESSSHGEFSGPGITNYRTYGKYRLLSAKEGGGLALIGTTVFNNVANNPLVGKGGSPIGIVEAAADTKIEGIAMAVNVGYRFRKKGEPLAGERLQPMGNQYIGSVGMSYLMPALDTKVIVEVFGSRPEERNATGITLRQSSSAELLAGLKFDATDAVAVHAGAGTELIRGAATPDWRVYAGLNWAIGPVFSQRRAAEPPRALRPTLAPREERAVLHNIHFATGSDQVPEDAAEELTTLAQQIKTSPYDRIVVEGHTDSVGSAASNQRLSERRAGTVRTWLITVGGVDPARIESIGYGAARPIFDNGNFQGRQHNRRVEVLVTRSGTVLQKTQELIGPPAPPK